MSTVKTVFLSSTYEDLQPYREAAREALRLLDGVECVGMEDFGARPDAADPFSREMVSRSDLYVGIIGHCYGSTPQGSPWSYTVREFEAALELQRPKLVFLLADDVSPAREEPDELQEKQRKFRAAVREMVVAPSFSTAAELSTQLVASVSNWLRRKQVEEGGSEFLGALRSLARQSGTAAFVLLSLAGVAAVATLIAAVLSPRMGQGVLVGAMAIFLAGLTLGVLGFICLDRELEADMAPYRYIAEGPGALERLLGAPTGEPENER